MTVTAPNPTYAAVADETAVAAAAAGLQARGYQVQRVPDASAARQAALDLLPRGAEVFTASSMTADAIGLTQQIDGTDHYQATRPPARPTAWAAPSTRY